MTAGRVVLLNGTSSAGKTSLAKSLQRRLAQRGECWVIIGIDDMFLKLPMQFVRIGGHAGQFADEGIAFDVIQGDVVQRTGPIGHSALAAYRASVGGAARAGLNVIVDEVLLTSEDLQGWIQTLDGLDARWIGVRLDLDLLEAREKARGNRVVGVARSQYEVVHRLVAYDLEVDTGALDPDAAAALVDAHLVSKR